MLYDIEKSYLENLQQGPFFNGPIPARETKSASVDFLGFKLASGLGVPAGPLLGSKWVALAAKLGFDVLVYKTIRSFAHPGHGMPNMVYVETTGPQSVRQTGKMGEMLSVTNSFGMPSQSPEYLMADIDTAKRSLGKGQLLIVSVVGTPNRGIRFLDDFVRAACFAKEAGAQAIEANFSCPNVDRAEGSLYASPETVRQYSAAIAKAIAPIPLILKVGEFADETQMRQVFRAAAAGGAAAICGLNAVNMRIAPPLDESRDTGGICGAAIRDRALAFVSAAAEAIRKDRLDLALMGCGGITEAKDFDLFFDAGALIAMSATGMMWNPLLAIEYHHGHRIDHSPAL